MNRYFTHRDYLIKVLESFDYNKSISILEMGTGDGSSQILSTYAMKYPNISIIGLESKKSWLVAMTNKYSMPNYQFSLTNWLDLTHYKKKYDLIFIDQMPWTARVKSFRYFKNCFKYCVMHDFSGLLKRFPEFKKFIESNFNIAHYKTYYPSTAIITQPIKFL